MNFDVNVTDSALDGLPQNLDGAAFDLLIDGIIDKLGSDPARFSQRAVHPVVSNGGNVIYDGFAVKGLIYLYSAYFFFGPGENSVAVWDIRLSIES